MPRSHQPQLFVTGATGQLGRRVIDALLTRVPSSRIAAGVRSTDHEVAVELAAKGVEVRVADYTQPETLSVAFKGIERLLLISSNAVGVRHVQHQNVIGAAKAAGVGLVAYTSLLHADSSPLSMGEEHRQTEATLKASGVPCVLLRHGWYTENHAESVPHALQYGAVLGCAGEGRFSSASRADFAEAAAAVLTTDGHEGRIYELGGDQAYTLAELAAAIAACAGKDVIYRDMSEADFKSTLTSLGLPAHLAELIADSDVGASKGGLENHSGHLGSLIGRRTTPWRQTIQDAVAAI